jgi:YHS domain-containing protein
LDSKGFFVSKQLGSLVVASVFTVPKKECEVLRERHCLVIDLQLAHPLHFTGPSVSSLLGELPMKTLLAACLAFVFLLPAAPAPEKIDLSKVKCLLAATNAAKEDKSSEWKDGNVYFCCDNCKKKFDGDKKAHASKANHQLIQTAQVEQRACPFSGGEINADQKVEFKGATVAFCCGNCKGKAEKMSDEDKLEKLFGEEAYEKAKFAKPEKK